MRAKKNVMGYVRKIIPSRLKNYIKSQINADNNRASVEYIINTTSEGKLLGRRIMVTGATGAIGSAICQRLVVEGAIVGICGRDIKKIMALVERFQKEGITDQQLIPINLDVENIFDIETAIDNFISITGGLDAFVNNAGGGARCESKELFEQNIEVIDRVLNTNLRGSILCARKASQIMVKQRFGKIINMSSVVGMRGKEQMSDYAAAKAGIIGFTKSLAIELGKYNVQINCISPGMVNQEVFDTGSPIKNTENNALGRFGYTDEVANLVAFVLSDEADYITGHNFVIDGGRSLGLMGD